jgi:hypothetical protein
MGGGNERGTEGPLGPADTPRRQRRAVKQHKPHLLGPFEYTLLALIVLGVAITIVMAVVNPSG